MTNDKPLTPSPNIGELKERLRAELHDYDCHALRLEALAAIEQLEGREQVLADECNRLITLVDASPDKDSLIEAQETIAALRGDLEKQNKDHLLDIAIGNSQYKELQTLRSSNKAMREALEQFVAAWESLPEGHYGEAEIQALIYRLKVAADFARATLKGEGE